MAKSTKKSKKIYVDYASGAMPNPSSIHEEGVKAKKNLESARKDVASVLACRPSEVIFTSGGTEGNNLAIQGITLSYFFSHCALLGVPSGTLADKKNIKVPLPHIITTNIEHSSVLETFKLLEKRNLAEVTIVGVEADGIVDPKKIRKALKKNTVLVSVMYANNEIGTIQPLREIAKEIRHFKKINSTKGEILSREDIAQSYPFFHTDAVQAVNYLDLNVERLGVDLLTLSGTKIEGAGRVGILYKKSYVPISPVFGGGDQEMGLRPGTENLEAILKFRDAFLESDKIKNKEALRVCKLKDYFLTELHNIFSSDKAVIARGTRKNINEAKFTINGSLENRLPNNVNITIPKIPSDLLVIELSARGIMASSKSACKSGDGKASYVIEAIRQSDSKKSSTEEDGSIRFSFGRDTTKEDISFILKALKDIFSKLERWYI